MSSLPLWHLYPKDPHLPPGYVASEVELGYALTAYGAQGMTVDESHVLVAANDPASLVCVAMTRGRDANYAHVVTEDFDEDPGHLQSDYGGPLDVLARALGNEDPATATASAASEVARESDPAVLAARYQTVVDEDRRARMARASETAGSELVSGGDATQAMLAAEPWAEPSTAAPRRSPAWSLLCRTMPTRRLPCGRRRPATGSSSCVPVPPRIWPPDSPRRGQRRSAIGLRTPTRRGPGRTAPPKCRSTVTRRA